MATDPNFSSRIQRGTYQGLAKVWECQTKKTERMLRAQIISGTVDAEFFVRAAGVSGSRSWLLSDGRPQKCRTTEEGRAVSGAKSLRFTHEAVEQALSTFTDHIRTINGDPGSPYAISEAVAFGDFLSIQSRVQAGLTFRIILESRSVRPDYC